MLFSRCPGYSVIRRGVAYDMSEIRDWVSECRAALAQAERLAAQLRRLEGGTAMQLDVLARRIATLRAAIDSLDALSAPDAPAEATILSPKWMFSAGSPWCGPPERDA